jgi:hypothetical protein
MSTQGFGRFAASILGFAASRFQRYIMQTSMRLCFKAANTFLLPARMNGMRATTSLTVRVLGVFKFYEINTRLTIRQITWTGFG